MMRCIGWMTCLAMSLTATASDALAQEHPVDVRVQKYAPVTGSLSGCTQIAFRGDREIVTSGDRLYYRTNPGLPFQTSPLTGLNDAHSVVFHPKHGVYYITDSGNHRLTTISSLSSTRPQHSVTELAGIKLDRPHDIALDDSSGLMYALNPNNGRVFRFRNFSDQAQVLDLSRHVGYSRALTFTQGRLYVVASSIGAVIQVMDFENSKFTVHRSHGKKRDAVAGSWKATGLVLNDVDFFDGYWYATSYFCPTYAEGHDCDQNKFIRFRTWRDFEHGTWDDLSSLLPSKVVPYYLTPANGSLFVAVFSHEQPGTADAVYRVTPSGAKKE